jgi:hypothetical protein
MCTTNHSGENNPIYIGYLNDLQERPEHSKGKLSLGLGLGFGFLVLIGLSVLGYLFLIRKKQKKAFVPRPKYVPKDPPLQVPRARVQSYPDSTLSTEVKDMSMFQE